MDPGTESRDRNLLEKWSWNLMFLVWVLGVAGTNLYLLFWAQDAEVLALKPLVHIASGFVFGGSWLAYSCYVKNRERAAFLSLAGLIYLGLIVTIIAMKVITPFESTYAFAEALKQELKENDTVAIFSSPDRFSDLPFHLKRRVMVVGADRGSLTDESLEPEEAEEMKHWFLDTGTFIPRFNSRQTRIFCLMEEDRFPEFLGFGIKQHKIVKSGYGKVLVSNI
jgi:hypothetical protein